MDQYPNLTKKLGKRIMVFAILLALFGFSYICNGVMEIVSPSQYKTVSDYVQEQEDLAAKDGKRLTEEQRVQWEELGRQLGYSETQKTGPDIVFVIGDFTSAAILLGFAVMLYRRRSLPHSKVAKMAARYTAHLGEENKEKALDELERELDHPVYDSKQLALTRSWIVGHVGVTRKAAAIPVSSVTGVYYYYLIRKIRGSHNQTNYFYQILINDKFDKSFILQLKTKKQLDEVFPMLVDACPNADTGNYEADYIGKYCMLSKAERQARIEQILGKNQEIGMAYCEL